MLRIGHGEARLRVVVGEEMGGYADRPGPLTGTHLPLEVHAVTIDDGARRVAIVVADLVCVNIDLVEAVRARLAALGIDHAWLVATHSHATPEACCRPLGGPTPPDLLERVVAAAAIATDGALRDAGPATCRLGRAPVVGLGSVRADAAMAGMSLPLDVVVVETPGGEAPTRDAGSGGPARLVGAFVVQPVHPTVLGADNLLVDPDLSGGIRRALRATLARGEETPWVVVATGAAGDISTRHTRRGRDHAEIDRLGGLAATALEPVTRSADDLDACECECGVAWWRRELELPLKTESTRHAQLAADPRGGTLDARTRWTREQARDIAAGLPTADTGEGRTVGLEALRLGDVVLVGVPGEPFLELGEAIRSGDPGARTVVVGYANGYAGYLPTVAATAAPGYEVLVSPFEPGCGEAVVTAGRTLLRDPARGVPAAAALECAAADPMSSERGTL